MICAHCKKPVVAHFKIEKVNGDGKSGSAVIVCSLVCLVQWAYEYGAQRGTQGVFLAKHALTQVQHVLTQLGEAVRGPKKKL